MHKKKLLVTTSTFPRWKNDTDPPFVYELSRRLTNYFDISVLTPNYPGAHTREEINKALDAIQEKFGSTAILPGRLLGGE